MYELEESEVYVITPESYTVAVSLAMGTCLPLNEEKDVSKCISLTFIDPDEKLHPIMLHPKDEIVQFLLSDEFRNYLRKIVEECS